ncbi:MAG TPA: hypothetical protein VKB48_15895 [Candidatus Acidoferrum sp.]|nr:hypothetical protein [Candidatus Acidoferrum sp.]
MRRSFVILSLAFLLPSIGQAQHPGGTAASGVHVSAAPAPMVAPHIVPSVRPAVSAPRPVGQPGRVSPRLPAAPRTTHPAGWNTGAHRRTTHGPREFRNNNLVCNGFPVPGLGFDFPHFFATHPNFQGNCFGLGSGFIVPFLDGGFYLPSVVPGEQPASQAEPEGEAEADRQPPAGEPATRETFTPRDKTLPVPAQQEYVFVKRDGTLIFAVAYSWINDRLQYVTQEGIRRTIPRDTLDLAATQQFNDQRGVPIQLPA